MKVRMIDILESENALRKIMESKVELDFKILVNLQKDIRLVSQQIEDYSAIFFRIVKKYGFAKEDGNYEMDKSDEPKWNAFVQEQRELWSTIVDVPFLYLPVQIVDKCRLSLGDQMALAFLLFSEYAESLEE